MKFVAFSHASDSMEHSLGRRRQRHNNLTTAPNIRDAYLASNLGVMQRSIALHGGHFDVSDQCDGHRIETDRRDGFSPLPRTHDLVFSGYT
jgi:deoxyxylulose-5-phosphate synthase